MNMNYIFLLKNREREKLESKEIENSILNKLFHNVTSSSFEVYFNKKEYALNYSLYHDKKVDMIKLAISIENKNVNDAKALNYVDNLLRKGESRKDYSIIVTYDGVSSYFCNKAYPLLNEFERRLRELVYIILVKTFGIEWYDKTVSDKLDSKVKEISKGKNKAALIESALHEMTMNDLEIYLFEPYSEFELDQFVKNKEVIDNTFSTKSKEEIVLLLEKSIPKSLWNRFFDDKIDDIQQELDKIREFRNKVAHNKEFYEKEYNSFHKIVQSVIYKIKSAIDDINMKEVNSQIKKESYSAYSVLYNMKIENAMKQLGEQSKIMQKALGSVSTQSIMRLAEQEKLMQKALGGTGMQNAMEQLGEQSKIMQKALGSVSTQSIMRLAEQEKLMQKVLG
ncbi:MAG TPA: hypothetical protein DCR69_12335, partial [Clostridium sp.]|nr:hypothetical protein [Clostridium sp.]